MLNNAGGPQGRVPIINPQSNNMNMAIDFARTGRDARLAVQVSRRATSRTRCFCSRAASPRQAGTYRYCQEAIYALGLLATAGWFGYDWAPVQ
jgi:hypothetical protein